MKKKCEKLLAEFRASMEKIVDDGLPILEQLNAQRLLINVCLLKMRELIASDGFENEAEEIEFFKAVKPQVYGLLVYTTERYNYENARPVVSSGKSEFQKEQLKYISRFFRRHEFFYQYYRLGMEEMDTVYFLRGKRPDGFAASDVPELDSTFATPGDYLFSKFIGLEMMQQAILAEMAGTGAGVTVEAESRKGRKLKWTGDSTNLIELLYGLFETKQFNDGQVDISDLVDVFEQVFHANLSNYFRRFTTIKRRKSVSKTRFLDEMRDAVNKRIDDADAYVPAWAKG